MDLQSLLLTHFDSGTPQGLATVIHTLAEPGQWRLEASEGERVRVSMTFTAVEPSKADPPDPDGAVVDIDLAEMVGRRPAKPLSFSGIAGPLQGLVGGAIQFGSLRPRVRRGQLPYSVRLAQYARGHDAWNSLALHEGDVFAVVPMRPGLYALRDIGTGRDGRVRVRYPDPREPGTQPSPERPADPFATVTTLACGQGLVLTAAQGSRFVLELVEPDDGPRELRDWQAALDRQLLAERFG